MRAADQFEPARRRERVRVRQYGCPENRIHSAKPSQTKASQNAYVVIRIQGVTVLAEEGD